jgi:hypothetical protein
MTQKNDARRKYLQSRTRDSWVIYETKRTEANRVCREKKRNWINNKIKHIEDSNKKNETWKFFKEAQFFNKQLPNLPICCKDKSGNILSERDILQRWKQYLCDLQSMNTSLSELNSEKIIFNNLEEVPPPTYHEVARIIDKLKACKSAGSDNIPAELIKKGGIELKQRIHKLITKIWEEETLPGTEWTEGIIYPIYKKGDKLLCSNYRPITLLNVAYKIFASLINNRISNIVESKSDDCRMGFRANRFTTDNLFIVRQITEKCHEFNIELHHVFIDYTQVFDSVYRVNIIKCLNKYGISKKLIKLVTKTLQNTKAKVKINRTYTESSEILTGVKQGDPPCQQPYFS